MSFPLGKQSTKTRHRTSKLSERERVGTTDEQFIEQLRTVGLVRAAERMQELLGAEDCIHCLREKVLELTDRLDQMTNFGALKPRARDVMIIAIDQGIRAGVRRAWKHSDDPEPDDGKIACISNCTIEAMEEWFHV